MKNLCLVSKERLGDMETPVSVYLKLCRGRPNSFLLESVETREKAGRYSVVAFDPLFSLELGEDSVICRDRDGDHTADAQDFFGLVRRRLQSIDTVNGSGLPAVGSLLGFIGYDVMRLIEDIPAVHPGWLPLARLVYPSCFIVFDHLRRVMILLAVDTDQALAASKIEQMESELDRQLDFAPRRGRMSLITPSKERFCRSVRAAQEYIRAGDIFQVVLSDSFHGRTDVEPFQVYRRLRVRSPSPYMFFLDFGDFQLAGSSPEALVKVRDGVVNINPIAGTRGRSDDSMRDGELEQELLESEKERSEHIMLVDLARNDAGRVCTYGSIEVDPYMTVERYSHVMHIVSQVRGRLRAGSDTIDAFVSSFPAGTVSGAPKIRAMEIIDELESDSRGPYAGAVGYFGPNGVMDMCIAIRTILFQQERFTVRVGAGIVADSIPEMEYKEIENKAAQSLEALRAAAKGEL